MAAFCKKVLNLKLLNDHNLARIIFERNDKRKFIMPKGTKFGVIENHRGIVEGYHLDDKKDKFITMICLKNFPVSRLSFLKKELLERGWKIKQEDQY
jgi:hypothetical protein